MSCMDGILFFMTEKEGFETWKSCVIHFAICKSVFIYLEVCLCIWAKSEDIISKDISYTKKNNVIHNGSEIEREEFENKTIERY